MGERRGLREGRERHSGRVTEGIKESSSKKDLQGSLRAKLILDLENINLERRLSVHVCYYFSH